MYSTIILQFLISLLFFFLIIKYTVCLSWNYSPGHRTKLASSNNRDVLLWDVDTMQTAATISNANRLPVSETAWCPSMPNLIATCCSDPTINLYDVRVLNGTSGTSSSRGAGGVGGGSGSSNLNQKSGQKPVISLSAPGLLSANVIAFNRINGWLLASAHHNQLWFWDIRGGTGSGTAPTTSHTKASRDVGFNLTGGTGDSSNIDYNMNHPFQPIARANSLASARSLHHNIIHGDGLLESRNNTSTNSLIGLSSNLSSNSLTSLPRTNSGNDIPSSSTLVADDISSLSTSSSSYSTGGYALCSVTNHTKRIIDLDWSYHSQHQLATASADKTVCL